jgi:hypothetical protein
MDNNNHIRLPSSQLTGLRRPARRSGAPSQTSDAYIDSKLLPFCMRLCGIFKVWCCCIRIRGCSRATNHLHKAAEFKLNTTKRQALCAASTRITSRSSRMNSRPLPVTYHGHRQQSYLAIDTGEQVEIRARHRTFDNAYLRTCLANLSYSAIILKLFDSRFYNSTHFTPLRGNQHLTSGFVLASRTTLCYSCSTTVGHCLYTASSIQSGFL